jgi:hypothetical protein
MAEATSEARSYYAPPTPNTQLWDLRELHDAPDNTHCSNLSKCVSNAASGRCLLSQFRGRRRDARQSCALT